MDSTPAWISNLPELFREDMRNGEAVGLGLAVVLILAMWATLPKHAHRLVRRPVIFLVIHFAAHSLRRLVFTGSSNVAHVLTVIAVLTLLACIGQCAVTLVLDVGFGRRMSRPPPKIIRDLLLAVVYILVCLTSLHAAGIEPGSILTTSALLTAVVGLSLQETLGNLFAGLALQMQSPFEVGDWIQFGADGKMVGKVLEINWRATKLLTLDEVEVIVPNGLLGKTTISNYTKPSPRLRRNVFVTVSFDVPPRKAQRVIADAIKGSFGVLDEPAPSIVTADFNESGTSLWVRFWTDQFQKWGMVDGEVRDRIWYGMQRAGIELTFPHRDIRMHEVNEESRDRDRKAEVERNRAALRVVDFVAALPPQDIERLASAAEVHTYATGEVMVKKGDKADQMFIVLGGEVAVRMPGQNGGKELARLGPGKFFGEMALMTGEPRSADVVATRDSQLLVVGHEAFQDILAAHPETVETVSRVIAERQAKLDAEAAEVAPTDGAKIEERTSVLLGKIKKFFSL